MMENQQKPLSITLDDMTNFISNTRHDKNSDRTSSSQPANLKMANFTGSRPPEANRDPVKQRERLLKSLIRLVTKSVKVANENIVQTDFCLRDASANPPTLSSEPIAPDFWIHDWIVAEEGNEHGIEACMAVDTEGFPLVVWLPGFVATAAHDSIFQALMTFGWAVQSGLSLGSGADSSGRNCRKAYRFAKGEISGCINLALWHAVGHEQEDVKLSRAQLGSSTRFSACEAFVNEMTLLSERMNAALFLIDPLAHQAHVKLRGKLLDTYPYARGRAAIDPSLFQGRSIIYNRQTPNHFDRRDPTTGWTPLVVFGRFIGGSLRIRRLGIRMSFLPGTCVWIRGRVLAHEVEVFEGGQRISIAHFCHQSVWDTMFIVPETSHI